MSKEAKTPLPINVIVAVVMHQGLDIVRGKQSEQDVLTAIKREIQGMMGAGKIISEPPDVVAPAYEQVARGLLCNIAHDASLANVFKALEAVGAPSSFDMIKEGIQAVADKQPQ